MAIINFYDETLNAINIFEKSIEFIEWIGTESMHFPVQESLDMFKTINYDNSLVHGVEVIPPELIVHFLDGSELRRLSTYMDETCDSPQEGWVFFDIPEKRVHNVPLYELKFLFVERDAWPIKLPMC